MAKRIENECAFCAEEVEIEKSIIGEDRKIYCSCVCAEAGENASRDEMQQLLAIARANRMRPSAKKLL